MNCTDECCRCCRQVSNYRFTRKTIAGDGKRNWIIDLSHASPSSKLGQCTSMLRQNSIIIKQAREKEILKNIHLPASKQIIIIKEIRNVCISARAQATGSKGFMFATWKQIFLPVSRHKKSFYSPARISRKLFSRVLSGSDDALCEWNGWWRGTSIDKLAHSSIILQFYTSSSKFVKFNAVSTDPKRHEIGMSISIVFAASAEISSRRDQISSCWLGNCKVTRDIARSNLEQFAAELLTTNCSINHFSDQLKKG